MVWILLAFMLALGAQGQAGPRPLISVLGTCGALGPNTYPLDTVNWFDAGKNPQVVFYSHMLFPVKPEAGEEMASLKWHPPLREGVSAATIQNSAGFADAFYAEAQFLDPKGETVAQFGLTMAARARGEWLHLNGRDYVPHTFALSIGTREIRSEAGQKRLPDMEGQYTVRFSIDGRPMALAFFRMLKAVAPAAVHAPLAPAPALPLPLTTTGGRK